MFINFLKFFISEQWNICIQISPFHRHSSCMLWRWRWPREPQRGTQSEHQAQPDLWRMLLIPELVPQDQQAGHRRVRWGPGGGRWSQVMTCRSSRSHHTSCHCAPCTWSQWPPAPVSGWAGGWSTGRWAGRSRRSGWKQCRVDSHTCLSDTAYLCVQWSSHHPHHTPDSANNIHQWHHQVIVIVTWSSSRLILSSCWPTQLRPRHLRERSTHWTRNLLTRDTDDDDDDIDDRGEDMSAPEALTTADISTRQAALSIIFSDLLDLLPTTIIGSHSLQSQGIL